MEIAIGIAAAVLVLVAGLLVYIGTRPTNFRIERSTRIDVPSDVVFAIINDLHQWGRWSPYDGRDPAMKKTFEGPNAGPGAVYSWNGNKDVGEGRLTIVDSKLGELVSMKLEFSRPFKCSNQVNFKLAPSAGGTRVSWVMDGKNNFMAKAFSLVVNMDKMVGKDFEQGLANLNAAARVDQQKNQHVA
ncbi:SRPBCC family protein [Fimbriiglobus ruber]|uniref:Polyketide cyclase n=1 Tax=Fimbriiglobus ruber TaxID=1908690 RepID=A0A225DJR4_9BACT|nr:SRPBCC family protein [Fimbriiglobus ruber]OWK41700.1 hypothetical protein FRUB_03778 [Fimbriiglobus ruber]